MNALRRFGLDYLTTHAWPGLASVAKVSSERTLKGKTNEVRYYLCSFKAEAAQVARCSYPLGS